MSSSKDEVMSNVSDVSYVVAWQRPIPEPGNSHRIVIHVVCTTHMAKQDHVRYRLLLICYSARM